MQTATDQDASDAQDKSFVANAPEVSFSTAITGASRSSPQPNQACNNQKRTQVGREMESASRTSLTPRICMRMRAIVFLGLGEAGSAKD